MKIDLELSSHSIKMASLDCEVVMIHAKNYYQTMRLTLSWDSRQAPYMGLDAPPVPIQWKDVRPGAYYRNPGEEAMQIRMHYWNKDLIKDRAVQFDPIGDLIEMKDQRGISWGKSLN